MDLQEYYRQESGRIRATLVRLLGSLELAEEALQDAFLAAARVWPQQGWPDKPVAWLISAGRFQAIDRLRSGARRRRAEAELGATQTHDAGPPDDEMETIEDDTLRLIFMCCHPVLSPASRIALTLREVCGLRTEEIADAYFISAGTIAQRIVRAKNKLRDNKVTFVVPAPDEWAERLSGVLTVIYLVFNEGYSASESAEALRADLAEEAIRLGRMLCNLMSNSEASGLLALMLLHHSRRQARVDAFGDLVLLSEQDRSLWDQAMIDEGQALIEEALRSAQPGPYTLQALISVEHCRTKCAADTDWHRIVSLYDQLFEIWPFPVVALNRAVAVSEKSGPDDGLREMDRLLQTEELTEYHLAHAARAELLRRLGRFTEAYAEFAKAYHLARQAPERRFLERRMREVEELAG